MANTLYLVGGPRRRLKAETTSSPYNGDHVVAVGGGDSDYQHGRAERFSCNICACIRVFGAKPNRV